MAENYITAHGNAGSLTRSEARDQTYVLMDTSQIDFHCTTTGTPFFFFFFFVENFITVTVHSWHILRKYQTQPWNTHVTIKLESRKQEAKLPFW